MLKGIVILRIAIWNIVTDVFIQLPSLLRFSDATINI